MLQGKVGLVGYGVSNRELLKKSIKMGIHNDFFVSDNAIIGEDLKHSLCEYSVKFEEGGHTSRLLDCDMFVMSPGISPLSDTGKMILSTKKKTTTELEIALELLHQSGRRLIIGITGTNGKSTVVTMLGHIMSAMGISSYTGGNLGNSLISGFDYDTKIYSIEVSSFQLKWFSKDSAYFGLSAITNIAQDHLDYHGTLEDYVHSKLRIARMTEGYCLLPEQIKLSYMKESFSNRSRLLGFSEGGGFASVKGDLLRIHRLEIPIDPRFLAHNHIAQNYLVAVTLAHLAGLSVDDAAERMRGYSFLEHRMQSVGTVRGVSFIDDSKATNGHAVLAALESLPPERTILILSGREKKESYSELIDCFAGLKSIVVLGNEMKMLRESMNTAGVRFVEAPVMEDAVLAAMKVATRGDYVLLSPGGSSYDLYDNYAERGKHFIRVVRELMRSIG